jgi:hypothetical protein
MKLVFSSADSIRRIIGLGWLLLFLTLLLQLSEMLVVEQTGSKGLTLFAGFNLFEAFLWGIFGGICCIAGFRKKRYAKIFFPLAYLFILFGYSDCAEVTTGFWYRPWWLFCWKAFCLIGIIILICLLKVSGTFSSSNR